MSKLESTLRDEIVRIARKEIRADTDALRKASARYRSEIAELKRQVLRLERLSHRMDVVADAVPSSAAVATTKLRFRADGLRGHRERLGVTAKDMAALLDVSVQTLANWESGKTKPRASQLERVAAVRKLGRRELAEWLTSAANKDAAQSSREE